MKRDVYETVDLGNNYFVDIQYDEYCQSPREWDNVGTIAYKHSRYKLGEEEISDPIDWLCSKLGIDEAEDYSDEYLQKLEKLMQEKFIILPLFLYDHSGITISTEPFGCRWDSSKVGYIYVSKQEIVENYRDRWMHEDNKERLDKYHKGLDLFGIAENMLKQEVETFDQYLRGEVFGFSLYHNGTQEELDSCWGYIGTDSIKGILEECRATVEQDIKDKAIKFQEEMGRLELTEVY